MNPKLFFLAAGGASVAVVAFIHFPYQTALVVGGVILALLVCVGAFFWEARQESQDYDEEHDL